jgi:hypothetical protein
LVFKGRSRRRWWKIARGEHEFTLGHPSGSTGGRHKSFLPVHLFVLLVFYSSASFMGRSRRRESKVICKKLVYGGRGGRSRCITGEARREPDLIFPSVQLFVAFSVFGVL